MLYIGVTANLRDRVAQHSSGVGSLFISKYNCHFLIYYEEFNDIKLAIAREKELKKWKRLWKLELIKKINPDLHTLNDELW